MAQNDSLEQQIYDIEENIAPSKSMWPRYILLAVGIIGIGGVAFTPMHLWPTVVMAYINCMLYIFFACHFWKKGTLCALIPIISPPHTGSVESCRECSSVGWAVEPLPCATSMA